MLRGGIIAGDRSTEFWFNDPTWNLSYWIATLAMEYKLLSNNGHSTQQTLIDLYYAIESINRVDIAAERSIGWSCGYSGSTQPKGFLIKIFDITDTEVYKAIVTNSPSTFNLGHSADGMCILKLYDDAHCVSKKIVIQR